MSILSNGALLFTMISCKVSNSFLHLFSMTTNILPNPCTKYTQTYKPSFSLQSLWLQIKIHQSVLPYLKQFSHKVNDQNWDVKLINCNDYLWWFLIFVPIFGAIFEFTVVWTGRKRSFGAKTFCAQWYHFRLEIPIRNMFNFFLNVSPRMQGIHKHTNPFFPFKVQTFN